jgi:hypothetical protein
VRTSDLRRHSRQLSTISKNQLLSERCTRRPLLPASAITPTTCTAILAQANRTECNHAYLRKVDAYCGGQTDGYFNRTINIVAPPLGQAHRRHASGFYLSSLSFSLREHNRPAPHPGHGRRSEYYECGGDANGELPYRDKGRVTQGLRTEWSEQGYGYGACYCSLSHGTQGCGADCCTGCAGSGPWQRSIVSKGVTFIANAKLAVLVVTLFL